VACRSPPFLGNAVNKRRGQLFATTLEQREQLASACSGRHQSHSCRQSYTLIKAPPAMPHDRLDTLANIPHRISQSFQNPR